MELLKKRRSDTDGGLLEGRFLLAMPGMDAQIFDQSVIYLCAHSDEGAMGFIVNKPSSMTLSELIGHTDLADDIVVGKAAIDDAAGPIRVGGPVDEHRGFVLQSDDYAVDATIPDEPN